MVSVRTPRQTADSSQRTCYLVSVNGAWHSYWKTDLLIIILDCGSIDYSYLLLGFWAHWEMEHYGSRNMKQRREQETGRCQDKVQQPVSCHHWPTFASPLTFYRQTPRSVLSAFSIQSNMPITSVTNRSRKPLRLNTSKPFSHFWWKKNTKFCYKTLRRAKVNTPWRGIITRTGNIVLRSCWTVGWRLGFRQAPDAHSNALT